MWGAIIGDLAGSIYEYAQIKETKPIYNVDKIICDNSFYSDDSILTVAIMDAILNGNKNYADYLKSYGLEYLSYKPDFSPYFAYPFSLGFVKWLKGNYVGNSTGNGAMMRVSSVGYLFDNEVEVKVNAGLATIPSHNSKEAVECATMVAMIIYLARKGYSKEDIIDKLNINLCYSPFTSFNSTCYATMPNCLYALFTSNSFEESILRVLSYGGDTDTNACIVGSMAEALYGIDEDLIRISKAKIPDKFVKKLELGYDRMNRKRESLGKK